jgi:undecaprenyl diphosphate synthase
MRAEALKRPSDGQLPPAHVAIIMDGNGRWANARGLPRTAGHRKGAEAVRATVRAAGEMGIRYLTLFGFSSENWRRPAEEVGELTGLLRLYLRNELKGLHENGVRLKVIGERERFGEDLARMISDAEAKTSANTGLTLTIALSYGGRQEIVSAARRLAADAAAGRIDPEQIDESAFAARLFTPDIPDPDLLVRTSGEQRVSNFLLWQIAYAEMVFVETLWPDFGGPELEAAVRAFSERDRRYGGLKG